MSMTGSIVVLLLGVYHGILRYTTPISKPGPDTSQQSLTWAMFWDGGVEGVIFKAVKTQGDQGPRLEGPGVRKFPRIRGA